MSQQQYQSTNPPTKQQQPPTGYVSKRQYNVAMQALELLEGEREHVQAQQRLMRMALLISMPPPPHVNITY